MNTLIMTIPGSDYSGMSHFKYCKQKKARFLCEPFYLVDTRYSPVLRCLTNYQ